MTIPPQKDRLKEIKPIQCEGDGYNGSGVRLPCKCVVFMRQRQGKAIPIGPDFQFATLYENGEVRDPAEVITEEMVEDFLLDQE